MNKFLLLLIVALFNFNLLAQKNYNFIVIDTVTLNNPVLFNLPKYDGEFIVDKEILQKNSEKKSLIKKGKTYIYSSDFYYYLNNEEFNLYDYLTDGGCDINKKSINTKTLSYSQFTNNPEKFIVCLIKASYYDKKTASADIGKTYYHKSKKNTYYEIIFPLCE